MRLAAQQPDLRHDLYNEQSQEGEEREKSQGTGGGHFLIIR